MASDFHSNKSPLHLASKNQQQQIAQILISKRVPQAKLSSWDNSGVAWVFIKHNPASQWVRPCRNGKVKIFVYLKIFDGRNNAETKSEDIRN